VPQIQGAAAKAAAVAKQQQDGKASKAQLKEKQVAIINLLRHPEEKILRSCSIRPMNLSSPCCDIDFRSLIARAVM
jgi:hypothetical protein